MRTAVLVRPGFPISAGLTRFQPDGKMRNRFIEVQPGSRFSREGGPTSGPTVLPADRPAGLRIKPTCGPRPGFSSVNPSSASGPRTSWSSLLAAAASYLMWGLFPLYWKHFHDIDATELIAHRMVWALVFLLLVIAAQGAFGRLGTALSTRSGLLNNLLSGALLTANWLVYVWGVNHGHIIDTSLGYFLVPLLNVLLGRWFFGETLRPAQLVAVILATIGVAVLIWQVGRPPWIALALAGTFGFYGLLRKRSPLGALLGLTAETLLLAPLAIAFLTWRWHVGTGALGRVDPSTTVLLVSTGVVTAIPLLLFAKGARGLRLTSLGLLQYLAPTCQFLLGWLVYDELLSRERAAAFALIWLGLLVYSLDAILKSTARPGLKGLHS